MFPNIQIGSRIISSYMIFSLAGILLCLYYCYHQAEEYKLDEFHALYMILFSSIGVVFGAHLLYGFTNFSQLVHLMGNILKFNEFNEFLQEATAVFGGSVFYGGLFGGLCVGLIYIRYNHLNLGDYSDLVAPAIPLFHFWGRLGCFTSGCCYGIPWEDGVLYRFSLAPFANGVCRFPVQLVEAVFNLILFAVLHILFRKKRAIHLLLPIYLSVYPVYRFVLEYFRGDMYRGFIGIFSTSQFISIILLCVDCIFWISHFRHKKYMAAL